MGEDMSHDPNVCQMKGDYSVINVLMYNMIMARTMVNGRSPSMTATTV